MYCNRSYTELKQDPGKPYNAVGYLNNGCTAFLIDPNHIVAAAHCFVNTETGAWVGDLRFYPNFHPDRVDADEKHVPRGDVTRAVVGSRAGESLLGAGMDWGIARIDNWKDTAGLDLTPLALAALVPAPGTSLVNPAYTRHHFPYNDNDSVTWDNMEWDTTHCPPGGWTIRMRCDPAPIFDGVHPDWVGCNSRWGAGMIHKGLLTSSSDDVVVHNCDTIGGSSGSPIMYKNAEGKWSVIAVGHGGGSPATASSNNFFQPVPVCTPDTPNNSDNVGASVDRFRDAPRFASNVAVHRHPDNASATSLFAIDSDTNKVVYRVRTGSTATATYTDKFSYWKSLGTPYSGAKLTRIAACSADDGWRPQVFVVADNAKIYTRSADRHGRWSPWASFGVPSSSGSVVDIDAARDDTGRSWLFMVANGGSAFTRWQTSGSWGSWKMISNGSYKSITALNVGRVIKVAMVDTAGDIWRTGIAPGREWEPAQKLSRPPGVSAWRDIGMTWDEAARGFMLAIPTTAGNKLWFMPMYGSEAWSEWRFFDTHLWAPSAKTPQDSPNLQSITASRWMEDPAGITSPVVFATDDSGNIYFVEYTRVGTPRWVLDWKSFYHENIVY